MAILFKFIIGILLVQSVTVVLVILTPEKLEGIAILRLLIPLFVIGIAIAFWFASIAQTYRKDQLAKVKANFAQQREKILVNAERSKARVMKDAQKEVAKESRSVHAKANFKVGASFAAAIGVGGLLLLTQFLTIGLLLVTSSGGALAGYLYKTRQQSKKNLASPKENSPKLIKTVSATVLKKLKKPE
ncbi:MAG: hypothetical protein KAH22_06510 [Thiotrichaceae bacterium]|nr:hypothetical protein [Thiotrichaceae bacterium]